MADEAKQEPKAQSAVKPTTTAVAADDEHYEIVSEYRVGEGPPPLFLVICFLFIVMWAMFSWIPFFGY